MKILLILSGFILCTTLVGNSQVKPSQDVQKIIIQEKEKWFGGAVNEGHNMPFQEGYRLNLYGDNKGNQSSPLLLSSKGRFIWSEEPFQLSFHNN